MMEHLNRPRGRHRRVSQVISPPTERRGIGLGDIARLGLIGLAPLTGGASLSALPAIGALGGGSNLGNIAQAGIGALGTIQGARQQGQANELQRRAVAQAEADFAARQPFRDQLLASLQGGPAQRQDLGGIFGTENPFSRSLGPIGPPPGPPAGQPLQPGVIQPPRARTVGSRGITSRRRGGANRREDELV